MLDVLSEQAELINFDYTGESRADCVPIDETVFVTKFCNVQESTNIKVKFDTDEI